MPTYSHCIWLGPGHQHVLNALMCLIILICSQAMKALLWSFHGGVSCPLSLVGFLLFIAQHMGSLPYLTPAVMTTEAMC